MQELIKIIFPVWMGCYRRWFGGGFDFLGSNRFLQHIIGFLACSFALWGLGYSPIQIIACGGVLQGLFWARAVGMWQDIGNGTTDEKMLERYNDQWFKGIVDKLIPNHPYSDLYDYVGLTLRYTFPAILISIILMNPVFLLAGLLVASTYAFMWKLYNYGYTKDPTEWAEFLSGVLVGFLLTL